MYIEANTYTFAQGYHDGRMGYDYDFSLDDEPRNYYLEGYEAGVEDRSEQDERN